MSVPLMRQTPGGRDLILGWVTGDAKFLGEKNGPEQTGAKRQDPIKRVCGG